LTLLNVIYLVTESEWLIKQENYICNKSKCIIPHLGMSKQELANLAAVTRQTISAVESGLYAPSVAISLGLAKALGCQVEELFWLEQDLPQIEAVLTKPVNKFQQLRVSLARVGAQWIAYPLVGKDAFRQDMIPADGEGERLTDSNKLNVRLLDDNIDRLYNTVVIAGCSPVISLWARTTERWHPQLRVQYNFANSMTALHSLCRGKAHIARMHLYDVETGEYNTPFVRKVLVGKEAVIILSASGKKG
jgi:DNA-binding XRE family transcriptional regulator